MYVCMYVCIYGWMDGCMYVWMDGCMYACMYVAYIHTYASTLPASSYLPTYLQTFQCRKLLEHRGSLIIRQFCVLLNARSIYMSLASALSAKAEHDLDFVAMMVQVCMYVGG